MRDCQPSWWTGPLLLALVGCCLGGPSLAQEPEPPTSQPPSQTSPAPSEGVEWQFRGVLWNSYNYSFNRPANGINTFRGYDARADLLKLDLLELDLQHGLDQPDHLGLRLDIVGGASMPRIDAAANLFRDEATGLTNTDFDIRQVFVSYQTESGLRLDAGKFATIFGYEVMPGVDGINPNATSAWSYTYSPFTHTGLRVIYPLTDQLTLTGLFVTGADTFTDNNNVPSVGGQLAYRPSEEIQLLVNVLNGPERWNNNLDNRRLLEFVGSFQVHDQVKLGLQALTGIERFSQGLASPYTANWNALVLYLETELSENFGLNFRQEWFNDPQGARLGVPQNNLRGFTITPEWAVTEDLTLRLDYRIDNSSQPAFDRQGVPVNGMPTLYFNQVLRF